jgi:hypothetical protein
MAFPDDIGAVLSKPNTRAGMLQRAVLTVLFKHNRDGEIPTNGRFVFYELEQPRWRTT